MSVSDPTRLMIRVQHADGSTSRWAEDEPGAENIFDGLTIETSIPGGYKSATCTLPRLTRKNDDLAIFDAVEIFGPGRLMAYAGYQSDFPWQTGDSSQVTVDSVGWNAALGWRSDFAEIYIDRDLTHWIEPSIARKLALAPSYDLSGSSQATPDTSTGAPGLVMQFPQAPLTNGLMEIYYDAHSCRIAAIQIRPTLITLGLPDAVLTHSLFVADDDVATGVTLVQDLKAINGTTAALTATQKRFALIQLSRTGTWGTASLTYAASEQNLAVIGAHGLVARGVVPNLGFFASDVIQHVIAKSGVPIKIDPENFLASSFAIPHLEFRDGGVTPEDAIMRANAFELWDWGIYENGLFYRPPTAYRMRWRARLNDGDNFDAAGDTAEERFNGVVVTYTDFAGQSFTVGPPGSGALYTDASLLDTSPDNPLNVQGLTKYGDLQIGVMTTLAGAIQLGGIWLDQTQQPSLRGSIVLSGMVRDDSGNRWPSWYVRAGDSVTIEDELDGEEGPERRIINTAYAHDGRQNTADLDSLPTRLDAIMEQMQAELVGAVGA